MSVASHAQHTRRAGHTVEPDLIATLSFLFLDDFEGNANTSVAIKSGSTVCRTVRFIHIVHYSSISSCSVQSLPLPTFGNSQEKRKRNPSGITYFYYSGVISTTLESFLLLWSHFYYSGVISTTLESFLLL